MSRRKQGLSNIKTAQKARIRSKPRVGGSRLLELFILTKEKVRLSQHKEVISKKNEQVGDEIRDVEDEMKKVIGDSSLEDLTLGVEESAKKDKPREADRADVKKMKLDY